MTQPTVNRRDGAAASAGSARSADPLAPLPARRRRPADPGRRRPAGSRCTRRSPRPPSGGWRSSDSRCSGWRWTAAAGRSGFGLGLLFGLAFFLPLLSFTNIYVGDFPWYALSRHGGAADGAGRRADRGRHPSAAAVAGLGRGGLDHRRGAAGPVAVRRLPLGRRRVLPAGRPVAAGGVAAQRRRARLPHRAGRVRAGRGSSARWPIDRARLAVGRRARARSACWSLPFVARPGRPATVQRRHRRADHAPSPSSRATCRGPAWSSTPSGAPCWTCTPSAPTSWRPTVRAGTAPQPTLVIWPENSTDIDPYRNADANAVITAAAAGHRGADPGRRRGAGRHPGRGLQPWAIVWDPVTGPGRDLRQAASAAVRRVHAVPVVLPDLLRQGRPAARRPSCRATRPGNLDVAGVNVGDVICFEVVYDDLVRDVVNGGAQVLVVQTNNATFGYTNETYQQQAMSRVRAVEHGREVLISSTSGVSDGDPTGRHRRVHHPAVHPGLPDPGGPADHAPPLPVRFSVARWNGSSPWPRRWRWPWSMIVVRAGRRRPITGAATAHRSRRRNGGPSTVSPESDTPPSQHAEPDEPHGDKVLVIIPTYDERENLPLILDRLLSAVPAAHVLVADDGSPDGTGADRRRAGRRRRAGARPAPDGEGRAWAPPTSPGSAGAWSAGTTCWSRWTPTGRTHRSSCPGCWMRCSTRMSCSAPGTSPAARWSTGRSSRECALPRREPVLAVRPRGADLRHHRRLPGLPGRGAADAAAGPGRLARATASRSTWPGGRCRPGSGSPRCRSPSPNGRSASRR